MDTDDYTLFRKFFDFGRAEEFGMVLKDNGIEYQIVDNAPPVDITFTGNPLEKEILVKIKQSDFEKANKLFEEQSESINDQVVEDHYLYDFSNEELYDVLKKYDEWSEIDFKLAQKILTERGEEINSDLVSKFKKERLDYLEKPEKSHNLWIVAGYVFSILGGVLGIFIGWLLMTNKKILPNGQKVYANSKSDRDHGRNIFITGIIIFPIEFISFILSKL